jgi:cell division septum initiation protein DivIVA
MRPDDDRDLLPSLGSSQFDVVRRGYDRDQVDDTIDGLQADLQILAADRDETRSQATALANALDAARREIEDLHGQLHRASRAPINTRGMSERLQRMLRLAQDEAAEIRARAESLAAQTQARAEHEGASLRTRYQRMMAEAAARRREMEAEHERLLQVARQQAEELVRSAQDRATALESEGGQRRRQIEEDFEITMTERRNEVVRELADLEVASRAEAQRCLAEAVEDARRRVTEATTEARQLLTDAEQRSTTMVEDAHSKVEQLRMLHHVVADQLLSVRSTLDEAFRELGPDPDDPAPDGESASREENTPPPGTPRSVPEHLPSGISPAGAAWKAEATVGYRPS